MIRYLDTSAALKLVVDEAESEALASFLDSARDVHRLTASWLLYAELHCAVRRRLTGVDALDLATVLGDVVLVDVKRGDFLAAPSLPGQLRFADAIHLAVALRVEADEMITYDAELAAAATEAGLTVVAPRRLASGVAESTEE